jgi:hypothetical protein
LDLAEGLLGRLEVPLGLGDLGRESLLAPALEQLLAPGVVERLGDLVLAAEVLD